MEHQHKSHWTKPPPNDERLYRYFTGNDLEPGSMHGAFQHMAETSFARGVPDPDARMVNSGAVGFAQRDELDLLERGNADGRKRERVSRAQEHRETRAMLAQIGADHVEVLRLAYGPTDAIPALKLGADPQARAKLDGGAAEARSEREKAKRLGAWRQLLPVTAAAHRAYEVWLRDAETSAKERAAKKAPAGVSAGEQGEVEYTLEVQLREARRDEEFAPLVSQERKDATKRVRTLERQLEALLVLRPQPEAVGVSLTTWLVRHAPEKVLSAARVEAHQMVVVAWNLWADVRGRRRRAEWLAAARDIR